MGSGGGAAGIVVASDGRCPWFETRHWQNLSLSRQSIVIEKRAVVGHQLVERSFPTPKLCSSYPGFSTIFSSNRTIKKMKKRKRSREWPIFKKVS